MKDPVTVQGPENESESAPISQQSVTIRDVPPELVWKIAGMLAVALILGLLILEILLVLLRPLAVLLASVVLAMALAPLVEHLERRMPRLAAIALVYSALLLILVGVSAILIHPVVTQASNLIDNLPEYFEGIQVWLSSVAGIETDGGVNDLAEWLQPATGYLVSIPLMLATIGFEAFIWVFLSLYWLHSMPRMKAFFVSLFAPHHQKTVSDVLSRMGTRMGGYIRGVIITGVAVGAAVYVGLTLLGVRYALLLAILAFLGEFFPNLGPFIAAIPAVIVALTDSTGLALLVIVFYVAIQQIESYILTPIVMRGQVEIPPLATTFAIFTGFLVGGVLWAILAIPIFGALLTLTTDVIAPAIRRRSGASVSVSRE